MAKMSMLTPPSLRRQIFQRRSSTNGSNTTPRKKNGERTAPLRYAFWAAETKASARIQKVTLRQKGNGE